MKKAILVLFIQALWVATGFSENPRWAINDENPIPAHTNLDVRWETSTNMIPSKMWVYRLLPNRFSPAVISNLTTLCAIADKEKIEQDTNGMTFQSADGSRKLTIAFLSGSVHYEIPEGHYGPTNLTKGVPEMSQLPELATNFVKLMDIPLFAITGYFETDKFNLSEVGTVYFLGDITVTNIESRTLKFRRSVEGIPFVGGDGCSIDFGEHGKISRLSIDWHNMKRFKSCRTVSRKTVTNLLRQGKAFQGMLPMSIGSIDWPTVKNVTIKKSLPCYFAGDSDWLYPFQVLFTSVDTGHGEVDVQIECPIIDETKL